MTRTYVTYDYCLTQRESAYILHRQPGYNTAHLGLSSSVGRDAYLHLLRVRYRDAEGAKRDFLSCVIHS